MGQLQWKTESPVVHIRCTYGGEIDSQVVYIQRAQVVEGKEKAIVQASKEEMKQRLLMKAVLQQIPKSELHLHLRGAMPIEVFTDLLRKYSAKDILCDAPPWRRIICQRFPNIRKFIASHHWSTDTISDLFAFANIQQFLATYGFMGCFIRDISDLRKLVRGVIRRLKKQNVVYAELTISLIGYLKRGISLTDIKMCLEEAAEFPGIRVQWIVDLVRDSGNGTTLELLSKIIELQCESIVGITLGGSEHLFPSRHFSEVYKIARNHGLRLTIHAGEMLGPQSVWEALLVLEAERIGHGVRAIEDKDLVNYLVDHNIPLEVCPTSNIRLGIFPSYQAHPVKALFDAGVPITISTDDPTFFGTTLAQEYAHLHTIGVQADDIFDMLKNGFKYAFLPQEEINAYLEILEQAWERLYQSDLREELHGPRLNSIIPTTKHINPGYDLLWYRAKPANTAMPAARI